MKRITYHLTSGMVAGLRGKPNGYTVFIWSDTNNDGYYNTIESYSAGNHPNDSKQWISTSDPMALNEEEITTLAMITVMEMMLEHSIPADRVEFYG